MYACALIERAEPRRADARRRGAAGAGGPLLRGGRSVSALPPAAWIFSAALPLNLSAWTVSAIAISPRPSTLTGSLWLLETRPRSRSTSGVTVAPASNAAASVSRLITTYSVRNGLWKPRFGTRRCSGIWPPSKPRFEW